jgi:hypothetical protein
MLYFKFQLLYYIGCIISVLKLIAEHYSILDKQDYTLIKFLT